MYSIDKVTDQEKKGHKKTEENLDSLLITPQSDLSFRFTYCFNFKV